MNDLVIINYLSTETWIEIYQCSTVDEGFKLFSEIFKYYFELSFPVTKVKTEHNKKHWLTKGIRTSAKQLKHLYETKIRTKNIVDIEHYKTCKKIYKKS